MTSTLTTPQTSFVVPAELEAGSPPEARGIPRDRVRLMTVGDGIGHTTFDQIGDFLSPGDLLVVNTSATVPAAVDGWLNAQRVTVHFSSPLDDGSWTVEIRHADRTGPMTDARTHDVVAIPERSLILLEPYPDPTARRLWRVDAGTDVVEYLMRRGRPISYKHSTAPRSLSDYQTVFAQDPGSAEMPSAGRPFSDRLVTRLVSMGISFAPITLHCAVSSLEAGEAPLPERFEVSPATARAVNRTIVSGGAVIAVGTTAARSRRSQIATGWYGRARVDRARHRCDPAGACRRRLDNRLARPRRVAPAALGGGRGRGARRARLQRGSKARLHVARVR